MSDIKTDASLEHEIELYTDELVWRLKNLSEHVKSNTFYENFKNKQGWVNTLRGMIDDLEAYEECMGV